jgi:hypothetical protein
VSRHQSFALRTAPHRFRTHHALHEREHELTARLRQGELTMRAVEFRGAGAAASGGAYGAPETPVSLGRELDGLRTRLAQVRRELA